eukprot:367345_1
MSLKLTALLLIVFLFGLTFYHSLNQTHIAGFPDILSAMSSSASGPSDKSSNCEVRDSFNGLTKGKYITLYNDDIIEKEPSSYNEYDSIYGTEKCISGYICEWTLKIITANPDVNDEKFGFNTIVGVRATTSYATQRWFLPYPYVTDTSTISEKKAFGFIGSNGKVFQDAINVSPDMWERFYKVSFEDWGITYSSNKFENTNDEISIKLNKITDKISFKIGNNDWENELDTKTASNYDYRLAVSLYKGRKIQLISSTITKCTNSPTSSPTSSPTVSPTLSPIFIPKPSPGLRLTHDSWDIMNKGEACNIHVIGSSYKVTNDFGSMYQLCSVFGTTACQFPQICYWDLQIGPLSNPDMINSDLFNVVKNYHEAAIIGFEHINDIVAAEASFIQTDGDQMAFIKKANAYGGTKHIYRYMGGATFDNYFDAIFYENQDNSIRITLDMKTLQAKFEVNGLQSDAYSVRNETYHLAASLGYGRDVTLLASAIVQEI